jgi:hypothetical protein
MSPTLLQPQALQQAASALGIQYGSPAFNDLVTKLARGDGAGFQPNSMPQEEISTIFVVGFPDDMSVRSPLFRQVQCLYLQIRYRSVNFRTCSPFRQALKQQH